jgi:hypothetical protein
MEMKIRGAPLIAIVRYVESELGAAARQKVMEHVPADVKQSLGALKPNEFYPVDWSNALMRGIAATQDDPHKAYDAFIAVGRYVADDAINSFLRLLVKFMTPNLFARKFGTFFRKDQNFGEIETDLSGINDKRFLLYMSDVGGYEYVAPTAMGWIIHTLTTMGCDNIRIQETLSPPPAPQNVDRYRFEVSWN